MPNELTNNGNIILYSNGENNEVVNVYFMEETFWLTQKSMAELFGVNVPAISKHLQNIFDENELDKKFNCFQNGNSSN